MDVQPRAEGLPSGPPVRDERSLKLDSLRTERLVLRRWTSEDRVPFATMNADPEVMEYFPSMLDRVGSDDLVDRIEAGFNSNGFGLWAVEVAATGVFIGFTGLSIPHFTTAFTPAVEVGWRLTRASWGNGFATEAARKALGVAFDDLALTEVVSFTSEHNVRSQAVMQRLGMTRDPADDFDHPLVPSGHRLCRQVLYRITAPTLPRSVADARGGGRRRT